MNTKHVPDVELCQEFDRLCKEKNITLPETEFYWSLIDEKTNHWGVEEDRGIGDQIPAPLVSEQGEWLSEGIEQTWKRSGNRNWVVLFSPITGDGTYQPIEKEADTEASARQKMINHLIAEGIITTL